MSQLHLSDEILMAFADGELEEPVAAAVEQAMLGDPAITRRVADFLRSRRLTRSAFAAQGALSVPPALQAVIMGQISDFEATHAHVAETMLHAEQSAIRAKRWLPSIMLLAASVAAFSIAAIGYFAGQQSVFPSQAPSLVARLDDPLIHNVLDKSASGQEVALATGRMRVISTYRLANGSLCREFTFQASHGKANAVACRGQDWSVTFALASPATDTVYTPSGGDDLMATYLQNAGAGEPIVDAAELKALAERAR
jgi:hypothetical protein